MTIGYTGAWTAKAGLLIRDTASRSKSVPQSVKVRQMLDLVGNNPVELDTVKMDKMKLRKQMKGFDPTDISVKSMGSLSVFLKERGLISDVTVSYTHLTLPTNREV